MQTSTRNAGALNTLVAHALCAEYTRWAQGRIGAPSLTQEMRAKLRYLLATLRSVYAPSTQNVTRYIVTLRAEMSGRVYALVTMHDESDERRYYLS